MVRESVFFCGLTTGAEPRATVTTSHGQKVRRLQRHVGPPIENATNRAGVINLPAAEFRQRLIRETMAPMPAPIPAPTPAPSAIQYGV